MQTNLIYADPWIHDPRVTAFFTTRAGNASVPEEREGMLREAGVSALPAVTLKQIHGDGIVCIQQSDLEGLGLSRLGARVELADQDGLITNVKDLVLLTRHADCLPVYLVDAKRTAVGMVHAGWRGTNLGISAKAALQMSQEFHIDPWDLEAWIGPGICQNCFEAGPEVAESFRKNSPFAVEPFLRSGREDRVHIDLAGINASYLRSVGVTRIWQSRRCTCCQAESFFSYRREGAVAGRMAAGICLHRIRIAIDGPSAAGKSTLAKALAKELAIDYIDTGAMYRAIGFQFAKLQVDLNQGEQVDQALERTSIDFARGAIFLDGIDVSKEIRSRECARLASEVSSLPAVRKKLVQLQRAMAESKSIVMDGRDIGTNVLPDAEWKFFLSADPKERARRRHLELLEKGQTSSLEEIQKEIEERDHKDIHRDLDPLRKAEDAIEIDTTGLTIQETIDKILEQMKRDQRE